MGFESQGGDNGVRVSPGGFEFGVAGWAWGEPAPKSITFFLDNTAIVADQYGRQIRRAVTPEGREVHFADSPPEGSRDGEIQPRPQFATHQQVLAALAAEKIDWLAFEVRYVDKQGQRKVRGGLTFPEAGKVQTQLIQDGSRDVVVCRTVATAGWPQLPYADLKKLPGLPPTPMDELRKIRDPQLRKDALRARREADEAARAETVAREE